MIIEKNRKGVYIAVDRPLTHDEMVRKAKLAFALKMREKEAHERYKLEHREGYCPHCHTLIPLSGICDCGYIKRK